MQLGLGWILTKVTRINSKASAILSNLIAFSVFVLLLYRDLHPGEPIDTDAVLFGLAVFAVYAITDLFWVPWKRKKQNTVAQS